MRDRVKRLIGIEALQEEQRQLRSSIDALRTDVADAAAADRSLRDELLADDVPASDVGVALRDRLDHGLLHAEALTKQVSESTERSFAELRSAIRLTQGLVERAKSAPATAPASVDAPSPPPTRSFTHSVPSFDQLYRSFEDRHRGAPAEISQRHREDYRDVIDQLPDVELPIVDLGCGRGELVQFLHERGERVLGVDANLGQLIEGDEALFVEADIFEWLDQQRDESHRAVFGLHVIEHLPLDLQLRLLFEARRVLCVGGALVLETPNALSLSTAATNFWVDPTHQRPVHPLFLEFLARDAGFVAIELRPLHPIPVAFRGAAEAPELAEDLTSLLLGAGDMALIARR